jgi:hypothetical protein
MTAVLNSRGAASVEVVIVVSPRMISEEFPDIFLPFRPKHLFIILYTSGRVPPSSSRMPDNYVG